METSYSLDYLAYLAALVVHYSNILCISIQKESSSNVCNAFVPQSPATEIVVQSPSRDLIIRLFLNSLIGNA